MNQAPLFNPKLLIKIGIGFVVLLAAIWIIGFAKKTLSKSGDTGSGGGTNSDGTPGSGGGYTPSIDVNGLSARINDAAGWGLPCNSNRCNVLREVSGLESAELFALSTKYKADYGKSLYEAFNGMYVTGCACNDPFADGSQAAYDKLLEKLQRSNF